MQTSQALARTCRVEDGPIASPSHVSSGTEWTFRHVLTMEATSNVYNMQTPSFAINLE
jgi:hypothetical protein